jgi:regulator of nucleoside diphosphate kinase
MLTGRACTVAAEARDFNGPRIVSESDIVQLKGSAGFTAAHPSQRERLEELEAKAMLVDPSEMPPDVVTMNTIVECVRTDSNEAYEWTLAYPHEADFGNGRVSVLSPIGIALFGARCGQTVVCIVPNGEAIRYFVRRILYQPEKKHFGA